MYHINKLYFHQLDMKSKVFPCLSCISTLLLSLFSVYNFFLMSREWQTTFQKPIVLTQCKQALHQCIYWTFVTLLFIKIILILFLMMVYRPVPKETYFPYNTCYFTSYSLCQFPLYTFPCLVLWFVRWEHVRNPHDKLAVRGHRLCCLLLLLDLMK